MALEEIRKLIGLVRHNKSRLAGQKIFFEDRVFEFTVPWLTEQCQALTKRITGTLHPLLTQMMTNEAGLIIHNFGLWLAEGEGMDNCHRQIYDFFLLPDKWKRTKPQMDPLEWDALSNLGTVESDISNINMMDQHENRFWSKALGKDGLPVPNKNFPKDSPNYHRWKKAVDEVRRRQNDRKEFEKTLIDEEKDAQERLEKDRKQHEERYKANYESRKQDFEERTGMKYHGT